MLSKDIGRITIGNWNARSFSECSYQFEVVLAKKSGLRAECVAINNEKPCFEIVKAETRLLRATKQVSKKEKNMLSKDIRRITNRY